MKRSLLINPTLNKHVSEVSVFAHCSVRFIWLCRFFWNDNKFTNDWSNAFNTLQQYVAAILASRAPTRGAGRGGNAPGRHFWWKEGIANGLSWMNLKLDLGLGLDFG